MFMYLCDSCELHLVTASKSGLLQCCDLKDIKLAYQLNRALEKGDNWKFLDVDRSNGYW